MSITVFRQFFIENFSSIVLFLGQAIKTSFAFQYFSRKKLFFRARDIIREKLNGMAQ